MKVVILHQHFNTPEEGGAIRSYYLAKALQHSGAEVVIVTASNKPQYIKTEIEGMEVHYLPVAYDNGFGFFRRSFSFIRYNWKCVMLFRRIKGVEVCYAISVPLTVGLVALWIKRIYKIPYIFEVGDLWPDAPVQLGFIQNYFFKNFLFALEKYVYKKAQAIVALSTAIQSAIENKIEGRKIFLIPNMADCLFYKPTEKNPFLEEKFQTKGMFVVSYIGMIGFANGLDYFLECANASRKQNLPIRFLMCGNGAMREKLRCHAVRLGLHNLSFIDFQNREGVSEILNVTDAAFVCYKNVPILETGSPNKFFDGLAAGKMIIINFRGWIKTVIEHDHCGIYVDPQNPLDFTRKIEAFVNERRQLHEYQQSSRALAEREYSRELLGKRYVQMFAELGFS